MTDLREKIVDVMRNWVDSTAFWDWDETEAADVADRIIALLPKRVRELEAVIDAMESNKITEDFCRISGTTPNAIIFDMPFVECTDVTDYRSTVRKMPELEWRDGCLFLGRLFTGMVSGDDGCWYGYITTPEVTGWDLEVAECMPEAEARNAVEAAVKELLGWK